MWAGHLPSLATTPRRLGGTWLNKKTLYRGLPRSSSEMKNIIEPRKVIYFQARAVSRSAHSGHETCSAVLNRWVFYSSSCCQYFHKVHLQFRWRVVGIHLQYFSFDKTPSQISEGREAVWRREEQSLARQIWKWGLRANLWLGVFLFYSIRVMLIDLFRLAQS